MRPRAARRKAATPRGTVRPAAAGAAWPPCRAAGNPGTGPWWCAPAAPARSAAAASAPHSVSSALEARRDASAAARWWRSGRTACLLQELPPAQGLAAPQQQRHHRQAHHGSPAIHHQDTSVTSNSAFPHGALGQHLRGLGRLADARLVPLRQGRQRQSHPSSRSAPSAPAAHLTGIGFASTNRSRCSAASARVQLRGACAIAPPAAAATISDIRRGATFAVTEITPRAPASMALARRRIIAAQHHEARRAQAPAARARAPASRHRLFDRDDARAVATGAPRSPAACRPRCAPARCRAHRHARRAAAAATKCRYSPSCVGRL